MRYFISKKSKPLFNKIVFAIGGGATIDEAKIYAKRNKKVCVAIPTTGAGATETTHAVKWTKNRKINIQTSKPITVLPPFEIKLDRITRRNTSFDILGHVIDYLLVCSDNEVIELGILAGRLIEKHPTNCTHPLSYPLTIKHKKPHGEAVGLMLDKGIEALWLKK